MTQRQKILGFWFPVVLYSAIIFSVSSMESVQAPGGVAHIDKLFHGLEYAIFGFLMARALRHTLTNKKAGWIVFLTGLSSLIYGVSDEVHQAFVPNRFATLTDVWADCIGGIVGGIIYVYRKS